MGVRSPSYQAGFYAPERGGRPAYPQLWNGCVGAMNSGLGPSGLVLRDWGGYKNDATLLGGLAFAIDSGQCIKSTTTSHFATPSLRLTPSGSSHRSVSCWVKTTGTARQGIIGCRNAAGADGWFFGLQNSTTLWVVAIGAGLVSATIPSVVGRVVHLGFTHNAATVRLYYNGLLVGSPALTGGSPSTALTSLLLREQESAAAETFIGSLYDIASFNRVLSANEMQLFAQRPGIAYELAPRKFYSLPTPSFSAAWARRQSIIIGGGLH